MATWADPIPDNKKCPMCDGKGTTPSGKICVLCNGTGGK
jgi:DnaJ-class molecular chaperone